MAPVITVKGISGSGKTWICQELKRRTKRHAPLCYDTDDLVTECFTELAKKKGFIDLVARQANLRRPAWWKQMAAKYKTKVSRILKAAKGRPVVFVGITGEEIEAEHQFFIKMKRDELEKAYRRTIAREIRKVSAKVTTLVRLTETLPAAAIPTVMQYMHDTLAMGINTSLSTYKQMYENARKHARDRGVAIKSQAEIIKRIEKLCQIGD